MGLFPKYASEYLALAGIPSGPNANVWIVDPQVSASGSGKSFKSPLKTLEEAYALCTANQNDVVLVVGGPTALTPTAGLTWAKNYTHLVGMSADISMGQRCRIVNHADNDLAVLFTLSASGCIIRNIQFFDGKDKNEDGAAVLISGSRNLLENCFVAGMGHATPAGRAGSYSLKISGAENTLRNCTIGLDTIIRSAANSELIVAGERNYFERCIIRSYSETAGKFLVTIDNSAGDLRDTGFVDCVFFNYSANWASGITNAFHMPAAGNTHFVWLKDCQLVGVGSGWADVVTHIYSADGAPNAGFGISLNPTT